MLLCTPEAESVQTLMRTLGWTNFKSILSLIESLLHGWSLTVASSTKFFLTAVNGWNALVVNTKISILIALGVLDLPLHEIKMRKLNKTNISEIEYY